MVVHPAHTQAHGWNQVGMAVLTDPERVKVWGHLMRLAGVAPGAVTKPDLRAAVNATDVWIDTNQASFVAALPEPFKTQSSAVQKTFLFVYVLMRRAGILQVQGD